MERMVLFSILFLTWNDCSGPNASPKERDLSSQEGTHAGVNSKGEVTEMCEAKEALGKKCCWEISSGDCFEEHNVHLNICVLVS